MNTSQKKVVDKPASHRALTVADKQALPPEAAPVVAKRQVRKASKVLYPQRAKLPSIAFKGNVTDVIKTMRNGVKAQWVPDMAVRFGLSQERLFEQLRLPKSTMRGRIGKNEVLSSLEQDRMYRADKVWSRALIVLEDENATRIWISRENRSLGGESPLSLLDTEAGYELVLDTLSQIEYGIVS